MKLIKKCKWNYKLSVNGNTLQHSWKGQSTSGVVEESNPIVKIGKTNKFW